MQTRTGSRRLAVLAVAAALTMTTACGGDDTNPGSTDPAPEMTTTEPTTDSQAVTAACPLVDVATVESTFAVEDAQATENEPVKTGPVTTYSCDFSEGGESFLTVGVATGPASGTVEDNIRAALSNATGEPVDGLGEGGAYAETNGVGTAAGIKKVGTEYRLVFAHGAAGGKDQIVAVAREAAAKI
jgi:hypothetical protein